MWTHPRGSASDFECVWSCEIDRWCRAVYRYRFGETPEGDIRQVDPNTIPDFDLLCAGFPCQSFSVAGRREGFGDTRGTLFFEICRIARTKRPPLLLLENVAGLLSAEGRTAFGVVLESLGELGYDAEWQVLNSKDFGVPQNRERVFVVGHLGGIRGREVFPIVETDGMVKTKIGGYGFPSESSAIHARYGAGWRKHAQETYIAEGKKMTQFASISLRGMARHNNIPMVVADRTRTYAGLGRNFESPKPITNVLSGVQKDNLVAIYDIYNARWRREKDVGTIRPNFTQGSRAGFALTDGVRIRRLTPRECERLQGFPDDWTRWGIDEKGNKVEISDTQRYRMMGNAVTVNVVEFLARRLRL